MESDEEDWSRPLDDQQPGQSLEKHTGAISHGKETGESMMLCAFRGTSL